MNPVQKLKSTSILPALTPLETLRLIAGGVEKLKKGEMSEIARVTIFLSGATFSGFVAGIKEEDGASYVLMVEHDDARTQSINLVYVPAWAIIAVRVHEADQYFHLLSGGKIEAPKATMGIVTLRDKIADESNRLRTVTQADIKLEVSWETLTQDDSTILGLYEIIDSFMHVVQDIISDEFKRIIFKTMFNVIRFQNAQEAEIHQDGQILIVRGELKARSKGRFTREEFKDALNTLLDEVTSEQ